MSISEVNVEDAVSRGSFSLLQGGLERILDCLPAPTGRSLFRIESGDYSSLPQKERLHELIHDRLERMRLCGTVTAIENRHTTCGLYETKSLMAMASCHEWSCTRCWGSRPTREMASYHDRLDAEFSGGYLLGQVVGSPGWGPDEMYLWFAELTRDEGDEPLIMPFLGVGMALEFEGAPRQAMLLITHLDSPLLEDAGMWFGEAGEDGESYVLLEQLIAEQTRIGDEEDHGPPKPATWMQVPRGGYGSWPSESSVPVCTVLSRILGAADQALPLLVARGILNPEVAARWMVEEMGLPRLNVGGGLDWSETIVVRHIQDEGRLDCPVDAWDTQCMFDPACRVACRVMSGASPEEAWSRSIDFVEFARWERSSRGPRTS
jgi:hypothetical protein